MSHWIVTSGEIAEVVPVLDDGSGPIERWCDVVSVEAPNKRAAKIEAVKSGDWYWPKYARRDGFNPFSGLHATDPVCPHGFCWCDLDHVEQPDDYCEICIEEDRERDRLEDAAWREAQNESKES